MKTSEQPNMQAPPEGNAMANILGGGEQTLNNKARFIQINIGNKAF